MSRLGIINFAGFNFVVLWNNTIHELQGFGATQ